MRKNEKTGIFTIVVAVCIAIIALFYVLGYLSASPTPPERTIPTETPAPLLDSGNK